MNDSFFYISCVAILCIATIGIVEQTRSINTANTNISVLKNKMKTVETDIAALTQNVFLSYSSNTSVKSSSTIVTTTSPVLESIDSQTEEINQLADTVLLDVPFTAQAPEKNWDQPWQDACEEAALLMLDAYYKEYKLSPLFARDELLKLVQWEQEKGWGGSIGIEKIQELASWYMQETENTFEIIEYPTIENIKIQLAQNHPVYVVANGKALPNPHFSGDGPVYHALLIIGYDDSTKEFITNDPGTQHGEGLRYNYDDLMAAIRNWNGGEVTKGTPVILVRNDS